MTGGLTLQVIPTIGVRPVRLFCKGSGQSSAAAKNPIKTRVSETLEKSTQGKIRGTVCRMVCTILRNPNRDRALGSTSPRLNSSIVSASRESNVEALAPGGLLIHSDPFGLIDPRLFCQR